MIILYKLKNIIGTSKLIWYKYTCLKWEQCTQETFDMKIEIIGKCKRKNCPVKFYESIINSYNKITGKLKDKSN